MSILDEVLAEEYDRCERHKCLFYKELHELSPDDIENKAKFKQSIKRCKEDQRKIRRALGFFGRRKYLSKYQKRGK